MKSLTRMAALAGAPLLLVWGSVTTVLADDTGTTDGTMTELAAAQAAADEAPLAPDPVETTEPAPTTTEPAPTTTEPAPTTTEPTPSTEPASTTTTAVPVETTPPDTVAPDAVVPDAGVTAPDTATTTPAAPAPAARKVIVRSNRIQYILATIRRLESNNRYEIGPNLGNASGAYQYIASTWGNYAGYEAAYLAPPWIQDERAAADVEAILRKWNNDVSMVPIMWYYPAAADDPALLDVVPKPEAGNRLTIRQYQTRWLEMFAEISNGPLPMPVYPLPSLEQLAGMPPIVPGDTGALEIAFPVLGEVALAAPPACEGEACNTPRQAVIFGRKLQPVVAAADGVVTAVQLGDPATGDVSLTITDANGVNYHYAGLNDDTPGTDDGMAPEALRVTALGAFGRTVRAGQIIGFVGDSDPVPVDPLASRSDPVWPHLRFWITDVNGAPVDAERPILFAAFRQRCSVGIGQWSAPAREELFASPMVPVVVPAGDGDESTEATPGTPPAVSDGAWTIGSLGEVTAVGAASLVYPTEGCLWAPPESYGPGAGGSTTVPDGFYQPLRLPTSVWIAATVETGLRSVLPLRR